jgi:hypothetical protein
VRSAVRSYPLQLPLLKQRSVHNEHNCYNDKRSQPD